ncbi:NAD regulator [Cohaesibacter sp. CAU 1516]|nr:NAD regulator [Cohaesibacter sp. CAU 1516]
MQEAIRIVTNPVPSSPTHPISVGLNAAIIAMHGTMPLILEVDPALVGQPAKPPAAVPLHQDDKERRGGLPFGPFDPLHHRTLETGLRSWVEQQTGLKLGYVEQLYTFGDRGRRTEEGSNSPHEVSIGYLALTRLYRDRDDSAAEERSDLQAPVGGRWHSWYRYFPWEDWREARPALLDSQILPALQQWAKGASDDGNKGLSPKQRLRLSFGLDGAVWDEERVLDRYELLYEAGLVEEHYRDRGLSPSTAEGLLFGQPLQMDHRRILATAISRMRAKLKYRPVVFELMPGSFTLTELQSTVEAISGRRLHKQNFRRLVEQAELVEPTGASATATGGRPAKLFRFRRSVMAERPAPGLRLGSSGSSGGV